MSIIYALKVALWRFAVRFLKKPYALLIGLALLVTDIIFLDQSQLALLILGLIAAAKGIWDIVHPALQDTAKLRRLYRTKRQGGPLAYHYDGVDYAGWEHLHFGDGETAIFSAALNQKLAQGGNIRITPDRSMWLPQNRVSEEIRQLWAFKLSFDEIKIRLTSDLLHSSTSIDVQRTKYSASLVTNNLAYYQVNWTHEDRDALPFERVGLTEGRISRLAASRLSNHIGVDVIAIAPGRCVVQRNSMKNLVNPGVIVPSGSGSADWSDIGDQRSLVDAIKEGMRREMCEEMGIRKSDQPADEMIRVLGYARLTHMGGKPQFYGVAKISQIAPRIRSSESKYVTDHINVDFDPGAGATSLTDALDRFVSVRRQERDVSFSLQACVHFLKLWIATDPAAEDWLVQPTR